MQLPLSENEEIVCQSQLEKSKDSFISLVMSIVFAAVGVFPIILPFAPDSWGIQKLPVFPAVLCICMGIICILAGIFLFVVFIFNSTTGIKTQLILTNKRVYIYEKKQHDYKCLEFNDILSWELFSHQFVFETSAATYKTGVISNGSVISDEFDKIMPERHSRNTRETFKKEMQEKYYGTKSESIVSLNRSSLESSTKKEFDIDLQNKSKSGFDLSSSELNKIVLRKIGPNKFEVMRVIKSYTLEDISKISEKLNKLPYVIMENCGEMQAEIVIRELTDLGAEVYIL